MDSPEQYWGFEFRVFPSPRLVTPAKLENTILPTILSIAGKVCVCVCVCVKVCVCVCVCVCVYTI